MDFSNIKIIGFDLDQTLYPKSPEIDAQIRRYIYEKISEKLNISLESSKQKFDELYDTGKSSGASKTLIILGFEHDRAKNIIQEALEKADIVKYLKPDTEITKLLELIKEKYKNVDIITGSNQINTRKKLQQLQIPTELFSHIITADEGSKSDLSSLRLWLSHYTDYSPENFLYIGDRASSDFEKPKELGIQSILVYVEPNPDINCLQLSRLADIKKYLI